MYTEFHIKPEEIDEKFIQKIKSLFKKSKKVSIVVEDEPDETEYLLRSEANRKMLKKSAKEAKKGKLIKVAFGKK
jgi:hypothetical protein